MTQELEIWKDIDWIDEYRGLYQVSNLGRIKSLERLKHNLKGGGFYVAKERIMNPDIANTGYYYIRFCRDGKKKKFTVHSLVAKAFIPNPDNKPCVNHKDGAKTNNNISNLEWATYSENNKHAYHSGLKIPYERFGETNPNNKFTNDQIIIVKALLAYGVPGAEVARMVGMSTTNVSSIKNGHIWKDAA